MLADPEIRTQRQKKRLRELIRIARELTALR